MKLYNSANGFNQGNEFLIDFASCIKKQFPDNLICRFSNDHFAVVADSSGIEDRLNIIRKSVKGTVSKISMDLYVGICNIEEYGVFLDASEKAKLACNIQKKKGDNFIRYYDKELHKDLILQNYVVNHIDEAIANGYIKVYYQPVAYDYGNVLRHGGACPLDRPAEWIPESGCVYRDARGIAPDP